jgi:hypothetical protein
MYRELILNSNDFTRGDKNHPVFTLPEDIRFTRFCVKTCEFPNFYLDLPVPEMLGIITFNSNGTINQAKYVIIQPQSFGSVTSLVTMLNAFVALGGNNFTNPPTFTVVNNYWIGFSAAIGFIGTIPTWALDFSGNNSLQNLGTLGTITNPLNPFVGTLNANTVNYQSKYLRRLFGYSESVLVSPPLDALQLNIQTLGAIKATPDNYLLLRSSAMSGAMYTPNTTTSGSFTIANVISKIPVNQGTFAYGSYVFYEVNDSPTEENMFDYNGGNTNNFDLYFTRSPVSMMNDVVDFQGWNFSVTLGIITHDTP